MKLSFTLLVLCSALYANPFPDPNAVPVDSPEWRPKSFQPKIAQELLDQAAVNVVRVNVEWNAKTDSFAVSKVNFENSGTPALLARATKKNPLGSYRGELWDLKTQTPLYFDSVGTGQLFRRLTRGLTFRFPAVTHSTEFRLYAENPKTGIEEWVLTKTLNPSEVSLSFREEMTAPEVRLLKAGSGVPLMVNIYAEAYALDRKDAFFSDAQHVMDALRENNFPLFDRMEIKAAFNPSKTPLGRPQDLGLPVQVRDSFLGLYYPYWENFGRWYNVVYPTDESKYRDAIAMVAYDYPIALIDDTHYWGIGNFNELTAIPAHHSSFTYLLIHEFGHYFGLNEEYEGGGITELAFAPEVKEPWSQNISFQTEVQNLKWKKFINASTPTPTNPSLWNGSGPYGVYPGGYADTPPLHKSHKPGLGCVMEAGRDFCPICKEALENKIHFDLGE